MKPFLSENFLLDTPAASRLYFDYAQQMPIIDFHCHLSAALLNSNVNFTTLTELWLDGDHYKWRAMRGAGIEEYFISGKASDREKFRAWAKTVPLTLSNPLYHWTHLELRRYFGITALLNEETADQIFDQCKEMLQSPEFSPRGLIDKMQVEVICTTDDPVDTLEAHGQLAQSEFSTQVLPTFRPDRFLQLEASDFTEYLHEVSKVSGLEITDFESLKTVLKNRLDYFHSRGCRISDHGLPHANGAPADADQANEIFIKRLRGAAVTVNEIEQYKATLLYDLGVKYRELDWTMQLHLGPIRNNNSRILKEVGKDAGVDSIGDFTQAAQLSAALNALDSSKNLPRTILYNSNPSDNEVFASMAGNFTESGVRSKVQFGAAWWFLDQKSGIERQLDALGNLGLLSTSVGMLTDSRSLLSYPRHEYYRRILCNKLGKELEAGLLPNDLPWLGKMVQDICYRNAKNYFKFPAG